MQAVSVSLLVLCILQIKFSDIFAVSSFGIAIYIFYWFDPKILLRCLLWQEFTLGSSDDLLLFYLRDVLIGIKTALLQKLKPNCIIFTCSSYWIGNMKVNFLQKTSFIPAKWSLKKRKSLSWRGRLYFGGMSSPNNYSMITVFHLQVDRWPLYINYWPGWAYATILYSCHFSLEFFIAWWISLTVVHSVKRPDETVMNMKLCFIYQPRQFCKLCATLLLPVHGYCRIF